MADGAPWTRALVVNTSEYFREIEENILRDRKILAKMQAKGRVTYNHSGKDMNWKVKYRRAPLNTFSDGETITFAKQDRWKEATLGWRAYITGDGLSKFEQLINKGPEGIVKYYDDRTKELAEDIEENFADQLYIDGNATGNTAKLHGLESFFGSGATGNSTGFAMPSDSYAGLDTAVGTYGGTWTGTWPEGKGDAHYDFWSPVLVDYTDATFYEATTKTFRNTCIEALRIGITRAQMAKSKKGMMDTVILELKLYDDLRMAYEYSQELEVMRGDPYSLLSLGFTDVLNFDGVEVTKEFGLPVGTGYGLNFDQMELCSLQGKLFEPQGPWYEPETANWRFLVDFYGNARFNPRGQMKLKNFT
jgi:hypothetical protein